MFDSFNHFLFRTPINPVNRLEEWMRIEKQEDTIQYLHDYFLQGEGRNALYLASPELLDQLKQYPALKKDKQDAINLTLVKYFLRSCTRCTPYGIFATVGTGRWSEHTAITVSSQPDVTFTLDADYLNKIKKTIFSDWAVKKELVYFSNSSIYPVSSEMRYFDFEDSMYYRYRTSSFGRDETVDELLNAAKSGAPFVTLLTILLDQGYELEESEGFLLELIENKILISSLEPTATGDVFAHLLAEMKRLEPKLPQDNILHYWLRHLIEIQHELEQLSAATSAEGMQEGLDRLAALIEQEDVQQNKKFTVNAVSSRKAPDATLGRKVKEEILSFVQRFIAFDPMGFGFQKVEYLKFIEKFNELYENRPVPLMLALDPEAGLGYPYKSGVETVKSDILKYFDFNHKNAGGGDSAMYTSYESLVIKQLKAGTPKEIDLSQVMAAAPGASTMKPMNLCDTMSCKVIPFKEGDETLVYLSHFGDVSAARVLGRFGLYNAEIEEYLKEIRDREKAVAGEAVIAEVVHIPQDRVSNVINRPVLSDYEIPFITNSYHENRILPEDLVLYSTGSSLVLASKSLGRAVLPRISNAHSYDVNALPVYHFLGDHQTSGRFYSLKMYLNGLFRTRKHIPRIKHGNLVVHLATWILSGEDLAPLLNGKDDLQIRVNAWQQKFQIPDCIAIVEEDRELFIDLRHALCRELFLKEISKHNAVQIKEYPFVWQANTITDGSGNTYCAEFHLGFYSADEVQERPAPALIAEALKPSQAPACSLETHWLYYKLYGGPLLLNQLLTQQLYPFLQAIAQQGALQKWFFVRYFDADSHIRLRAQFADRATALRASSMLSELFEPLLEGHTLRNIQTEIYRPEYLRYGFDNMEETEQFFGADSNMVAEYYRYRETIEDKPALFDALMAMKNIDRALEDFGLTFDEKLSFMEDLSNGFMDEFGDRPYMARQCNNFFKGNNSVISSIFEPGAHPEYAWFDELLDIRTRQIPANLKSGNALGGPSRFTYLSSVIHMMMNRFFLDAQRKYEMLIYTTLFNFYRQTKYRRKAA